MPEDHHDHDDSGAPVEGADAEPVPSDAGGSAGTGSEAGPRGRGGRAPIASEAGPSDPGAPTDPEAGPTSGDRDPRREPPVDGSAARPHDPLEAAERGPTYEASRAQKGAALVAAGGLVLLIAGTVMRLTAGRCILPRTTALGTTCGGVVAEPWFGVLALVTVGAAGVGTVLAIRDLTSGQRPP